VWKISDAALAEAIDAHDHMRLAEGTGLQADLARRVETMTRVLE